MRIAVLENDTRTAQQLESWLQSAGHAVQLFANERAFVHQVDRASFDAAIVGPSLAELPAAELSGALRERGSEVPMIRVLRGGGEADIVKALHAGADDCMADAREHELLARVDALLRRAGHVRTPVANQIELGNLIIDLKNRLILRDGSRVPLTPKTYDLAVFLLTNRGRLLLRTELLEQIWGRDKSATTRTLDTHVSRLRTVLGLIPEHGWQLQSVYQHGYRLDEVEAKGERRASVRMHASEPVYN